MNKGILCQAHLDNYFDISWNFCISSSATTVYPAILYLVQCYFCATNAQGPQRTAR